MKVAELIEKLEMIDPDLNVYLHDTDGTFTLDKVILCEPENWGGDDDVKEYHVSLSTS